MTTTIDRPPTISPPTPPAPPAASPQPPEPRGPQRSVWQRYQQHAWIAGIAVLTIAAAALPMLLAPQAPAGSAQSRQSAPPSAGATNLATNVNITASEFKFSPTSIQVPLGQKVTFTLNNTGTVEHDVTVQAAGFTLSAKAGETATGRSSFGKAGVFDFFCSIPGHKEAGMKGKLTVVDPGCRRRASVGRAGHARDGRSDDVGGRHPAVARQPEAVAFTPGRSTDHAHRAGLRQVRPDDSESHRPDG